MAARILVVDDEPLFKNLIESLFSKQIRVGKYEFIFASNGKEALAKIQATHHPIDLILTDIKMPEMDGLQLLEELNNQNINTKAAIVSTYGSMTNIRLSMNEGAYDFLTKPFKSEELEQLIDKALKSNRYSLRGQAQDSAQVEEKPKHFRSSSVLKLAKELATPQRLAITCKLLETFDDPDELDDISYKLESQVYSLREIQDERDKILTENKEKDVEGLDDETFLSNEVLLKLLENGLLEGGYIEEAYSNRKLAKGKLKRYGPYFYLRWKDAGKRRSRLLGQEFPPISPDTNIKVYRTETGKLKQDSLEVEQAKTNQDFSEQKQNSRVASSTESNRVDNAKPNPKSTQALELPANKPRQPIKLYGPEFDKRVPRKSEPK
jgi:YesN/AraC family two-component response regulator